MAHHKQHGHHGHHGGHHSDGHHHSHGHHGHTHHSHEYHGNEPGNMSPKVEDYQAKGASYAEHQPGKTTEYISRTNHRIDKQASDVKKQAYKGRYD